VRATLFAKLHSRRGSPMARYYFHVRRGQVTILDREGIELADLEEAGRQAARRAWQIEASEALKGVPPTNGAVVVDDEFSTVLEVPLTNGFRHASLP